MADMDSLSYHDPSRYDIISMERILLRSSFSLGCYETRAHVFSNLTVLLLLLALLVAMKTFREHTQGQDERS